MKFKFVSSSTWHNKFLDPLASGLKDKGYETEVITGVNSFGSCKDCVTVTSYHADIEQIRDSYKIIF
jgi:hypothetical protein